MIAYQIQLRYVIRDKIRDKVQSKILEKYFLSEKNFVGKNIVKKKIVSDVVSDF